MTGLTTKQLNEILKQHRPDKYKEGWRAMPRKNGWQPIASIESAYKPRKTPCRRCGNTTFKLQGIGTECRPMWECKQCDALYDARRK